MKTLVKGLLKLKFMDKTMLAAIIGAISTILAAVISVFLKRNKNNDLSNKIHLERTETFHKNSIRKISNKVKLPPNLLANSTILNKRQEVFDNMVLNFFQKENHNISPEFYQIPELLVAYSTAKCKYLQWGEKINIELLIGLLIERLKSHNQSDEIYYEQALNRIDQITSEQLKFIILHHSAIGLLSFINAQNSDCLPNLDKLVEYLKEAIIVTNKDIDHLISLGLITELTPYSYYETISEHFDNPSIQTLNDIIRLSLQKLKNINIWSYNLSPVCRIISSTHIKEILNQSDIGFIYPGKQLVDFYVKNLYATENVAGYVAKEKLPN